MISPRQLFQKTHKDEMKALGLLLNEAWFQKCVVFAQAEMASESISQERLTGATLLMTKLGELTDESEAVGDLPDKSKLNTFP